MNGYDARRTARRPDLVPEFLAPPERDLTGEPGVATAAFARGQWHSAIPLAAAAVAQTTGADGDRT